MCHLVDGACRFLLDQPQVYLPFERTQGRIFQQHRILISHGIGWQEVEVLPDRRGKPLLHLSGRALALAEEQGLYQWAISLSHGRDYAVAFVVASE
jgi:phosphopantetheinyl transferase (holo-ACP synthase)